MVASISVPRRRTSPLPSSCRLTSASSRSARPRRASSSRKRQTELWSGTLSASGMPAKRRNESRSSTAVRGAKVRANFRFAGGSAVRKPRKRWVRRSPRDGRRPPCPGFCPTYHGRLKPLVRQAVPLLEQQQLDVGQERVGQPALPAGVDTGDDRLQRRPVERRVQAVEP